jgi:hypothetical protein
VLSDKLLERGSSLPSRVMRDLAGNVVSDVSLANSVENVLSKRTQELSVDGGQSSTSKGPFLGRVVG